MYTDIIYYMYICVYLVRNIIVLTNRNCIVIRKILLIQTRILKLGVYHPLFGVWRKKTLSDTFIILLRFRRLDVA